MAKKTEKEEINLKSEVKKNITIYLDKDLMEDLDKRAEKNFLSLREQIEDIVRRSMLTYNKGSSKEETQPEVEGMVKIFSRKKSGIKPKK